MEGFHKESFSKEAVLKASTIESIELTVIKSIEIDLWTVYNVDSTCIVTVKVTVKLFEKVSQLLTQIELQSVYHSQVTWKVKNFVANCSEKTGSHTVQLV